jgi:hypothetical protein
MVEYRQKEAEEILGSKMARAASVMCEATVIDHPGPALCLLKLNAAFFKASLLSKFVINKPCG